MAPEVSGRSGWIPALGNRVSTVRYPIPQRTFKYVATVHSVWPASSLPPSENLHKIGSSRGSLDHLVGDGEQRRWHVQANRLRHDQVNDEVDLVDSPTGRSAGFAPAKSCQPNRRRAVKVDEGHRADEDR